MTFIGEEQGARDGPVTEVYAQCKVHYFCSVMLQVLRKANTDIAAAAEELAQMETEHAAQQKVAAAARKPKATVNTLSAVPTPSSPPQHRNSTHIEGFHSRSDSYPGRKWQLLDNVSTADGVELSANQFAGTRVLCSVLGKSAGNQHRWHLSRFNNC